MVKNHLLDYKIPVMVESNRLKISDNLGGFDADLFSPVLDDVVCMAHENKIRDIDTGYVFTPSISSRYPDINFHYDQALISPKGFGWLTLVDHRTHPEIDFKNFLCSFNGSDNVGRWLLVSILYRFGCFDENYCSKNFVFTRDDLDGRLTDFTGDRARFYSKFFLGPSSDFFDRKISFDYHRYDHLANIKQVELKLCQSFVHLVSETLATTYYPFVTEKFLYSIVTRGLFLCWAPPGWHQHIKKRFGFKLYNHLFDYSFDNINNPVERLLCLISSISKFSILTSDEWRDLYLLESDAIEYNYDHYFSRNYLKHLEKSC